MDEKILIYIVIGIIYFIVNRLRKKKPEEEPDFEQPNTPSSESGRPKPISFEELLKEITEGKQPTPAPSKPERSMEYNRPKPQPEYVDYDDTIEDEEKSLESIPAWDEERTTKVYEDAKKLAFYRPSLEETLKLQDVNTTYGKFAEFETKTETNLLLDYTKDLRDPKGFKKALILSEILNRKHF